MFTKIVNEYIPIAFHHIFVHIFFPYVTCIQFLLRSGIGGKFPVLYIIFPNRNCLFDNAIQYHVLFCHFL